MSAEFRDIVLAMAEARPNARVSTIVALALAVENQHPPNLNDAAALSRWAMQRESVAAHVRADQRIHAIKELRAISGASLAQAKYAIDIAFSGGVR